MISCEEKKLYLHGMVSFDYSTHNGKCGVGIDNRYFGIMFTKASSETIYVYNDDPSILRVARVKNALSGDSISFSNYDSTSRF